MRYQINIPWPLGLAFINISYRQVIMIPLYWGSDPSGYLNQDAMINLANYENLETFTNRVHEVLNNPQEWQNIASRPILKKRPNLDEVVSVIRTALAPLVRS